jgi:hypothetical protein
MNWTPVLLLGLGAFLAGGVISMRSQGHTRAAIVLGVLAVMAIGAGALYAWDAQ